MIIIEITACFMVTPSITAGCILNYTTSGAGAQMPRCPFALSMLVDLAYNPILVNGIWVRSGDCIDH
jgi:hypothetical protein